jgi:hypothetical protein
MGTKIQINYELNGQNYILDYPFTIEPLVGDFISLNNIDLILKVKRRQFIELTNTLLILTEKL